jgi:hypothetical protein
MPSLSPELKRLEHEADHSHISSSEVTLPTLLYIFITWCLDTGTLFELLLAGDFMTYL